MPHLSVIIPVHNSESTLEKCLKAVRESGHRDYELVVVDCRSRDRTPSIAKKYADRVIELSGNCQRNNARTEGIRAATGRILVNIDSDVVVKPDTLTKIDKFFSANQNIDAVTGLLTKEHPNPDFFSQYKNLYMYYIFGRLPGRVTFLYGSINAIRKDANQLYDPDIKIADDTALGQKLFSSGKRIAFLRELEVTHLKKYNLFTFVKNDFRIPFDWAKIFLTYKGWQQLGRNKTGYAHSPKEQLASTVLAPAILFLSGATLLGYSFIHLLSLFVLAWFLLNLRFLLFLTKEKGLAFGALAGLVTFFDNIIMAAGILAGFAAFFISAGKRR